MTGSAVALNKALFNKVVLACLWGMMGRSALPDIQRR